MNKKIIIFIICILALVSSGVFIVKKFAWRTSACEPKEYSIAANLQSGERRIINFADNHCEFSQDQKDSLSFKVLADGAIQDNLYGSRIYLWSRNKDLSIEEQIRSLIKQKLNQEACLVSKNQYKQHDGLETYTVTCALFGEMNDLSSETFMEANDLLIAERQDGLDGIGPINISSIRFMQK